MNYIDNIGNYFRISDIGVFPTHRNYPKIDYPVFLLELMFMGKPVIVSDLEPYNEICKSKGAIKHVVGDYMDLAVKLMSLIEDIDFYQKLSDNAKTFARKNCTSDIVSSLVISQYNKIGGEI